MFDNQNVVGTLVVTNEEGEVGTSHGESWTIEAGSDAASIEPSADGKTCKVIGLNLPAGSPPVAVQVNCAWKNEAEEDKLSIGTLTVFNPPANAGTIGFSDPSANS